MPSSDAQTIKCSLCSDTIFAPIQKSSEINTLFFINTFKLRRGRISFKPTQNIMQSNKIEPSTRLEYKPETLDKIRYNYTISHPRETKFTWMSIPEPWRPIREGRKIKRDRNEYRKLAQIFDNGDDTNSGIFLRKLPEKPKSPWTISGEENIQLSQLYVSNWVKGGESSTTLLSDLRFQAKYSKNKHQWENNIIHKLGITHTSVLGSRLSDDVVDLSSKYGYQAINKWYYSIQNTFKTQFFHNYSKNDKEREKPTSAFLSPAYIQFVFGMDYKNEKLSLLLSPYTSVITLVADTSLVDKTNYSISENKKTMSVNGLSVTVNWKKEIYVNITYTTKCEIFYEYFKKEGQKRFDWENIFDMQINRYLATRLICELRYYDNESKKFQLKENFSIAFKYSF